MGGGEFEDLPLSLGPDLSPVSEDSRAFFKVNRSARLLWLYVNRYNIGVFGPVIQVIPNTSMVFPPPIQTHFLGFGKICLRNAQGVQINVLPVSVGWSGSKSTLSNQIYLEPTGLIGAWPAANNSIVFINLVFPIHSPD